MKDEEFRAMVGKMKTDMVYLVDHLNQTTLNDSDYDMVRKLHDRAEWFVNRLWSKTNWTNHCKEKAKKGNTYAKS